MISKPRSDIVGVILAGGQSRRMGTDKAFVQLAGRTLMAHCLDALKPQVRLLAINANSPPEQFASFGVDVLPDPIEGQIGPLAGILAAMDWAKSCGAEMVTTVPVDTPFLPHDVVSRLHAVLDGNELACAKSGGRRHHAVGLFKTNLADDLRLSLINNRLRRVEAWQNRHRVGVAGWVAGPTDPFSNINTAEDLAAAEQRLRG